MAKYDDIAPTPVKTGGIKVAPDTGDNRSADQIRADITQAEWDDYQSTFVPIQNDLIDQVTGQADVNNSADRAGSRVAGGFAGLAGRNNRDFGRTGLTPTKDQKTSIKRNAGLSSVLAKSTVENTTRRTVDERNTNALAGLVGLGRGVSTSASGAADAAAGAEADREAAGAALDYNDKQSMLGNIGAGASMGFMMGNAPGAVAGAGVGLLASLF